jgi:hypothetical protein
MIETCRSCLDLFNPDWVSEVSGRIVIREPNPLGKGEAVFESDTPCIMIRAKEQAPLLWALAQRKCADGAFFSFDNGEAHLHIVELKSKVTLGTWAIVVQQFEGMFLASLAAARLLEIHKPSYVTCYLAGTEDSITSESQSASPALLKAPVGKSRTFGGWESWDKEVIALPLGFKAALVKGWKDAGGVADFGSV